MNGDPVSRASMDRSDRGMTLIDTLISAVVSAVVFGALATAVTVMMRTAPGVRADIGEAHDLEVLLRYLPADVASTPPGRTRYETSPSTATGCSGGGADEGTNVLRMTSSAVTSGLVVATSYRIVTRAGQPPVLRRVQCSGASATTLGPPDFIAVADELTTTTPVAVQITDNGTDVQRVVVTLTGSTGITRSVAGSPMAAVNGLPAASTTTTVAPAPPIPACSDNPFRNTSGFEAFVNGDVRLAGGDSYGPVAVAGNLSFGNFLITPRSTTTGFTAAGDPAVTGLLVGGHIDWGTSSGTLVVQGTMLHAGDFANGVVGAGNPNETNAVEAPGTNLTRILRVSGYHQTATGALPIQRPGLVDFTTAASSLSTASASLAGLPGTCSGAGSLVTKGINGVGAWSGSGPVWLEYVANTVNVFNSNVAQLAGMTNVNKTAASAPASATTVLLINVSDAGAVTFVPPIWTQNEPRYVIWNFPNATSITLNGPLWGSLLAPQAAVVANGDLRGNVIAASLTANAGSLDWDRRYAGTFPWDPWVQP